jgi:hypothetical protein
MPDTEALPAEVEEPDTPAEDVKAIDLLGAAIELETVTRARKRLEEREAELRKDILERWERATQGDAQPLHGIRLPTGTAVRRVWSTSQQKIDPAKLREALADAPQYIIEAVDATRLRADYEAVWRALSKAKTQRTINVRLGKENLAAASIRG